MNVNVLSNSYLESLFNNTLQNSAMSSTASATSSSTTSSSGSAASQLPDSSQLSPFAQILSTLQQMQQSNPTEYQQVTKQISTDLKNAAQSAQSDGNTSAANQLNQLATDFTTASTSGQFSNIQDLAQALAGGHHPDGVHTNQASSDSRNLLSIIENTLSGAGITATSNN